METPSASVAFNGTNHQGIQLGVNHGTITFAMPSAQTKPSGTEATDEPHLVIPYAENENFVGRKQLLRKLQNILFTPGSPRRAALFGLGGMGKTQIAIQYAHWVYQNLGDVSVFWVHATNAERFHHDYAAIAQECQIPDRDKYKTDVLGLVKDYLEREHDGRWLMIIDNADDTEMFFRQRDQSPDDDAPQSVQEEINSLQVATTGEPAASQQRSNSNPPSRKRPASRYEGTLGRYLPDCAHGTILITTRNKQAGSRLVKGGPLLAVGEMTENEATELLCRHAQLRSATPEDLSWLSSQLGRLPLALVQAAGFVQENDLTVSEYSDLLDQNEEHFLDLLSEDSGGHGRDSETPDATTRTLFLSFEQIQERNPLAAEILSLMTFFDRQGVPWDFLFTYYGNLYGPRPTREIDLTKAMGILAAFSLVAYAFYPHTNLDNLDFCKEHLPHVFAVLKEPTESPDKKLARASLLSNVAGFLDLSNWVVAELLFTQALDIRKELLGGKLDDHGLKCIHGIAQSYYRQRRLDEAEPLLMQVIQASSSVADETYPNALLLGITTLALVYAERKQWEDAKDLQIQLYLIARDLQGGTHLNTLHRMGDLATTTYFLRDFEATNVLDNLVMEGYKAALGEDHFMTMMAMGCLAGTMIAGGDYFRELTKLRYLLWASTQTNWECPWDDMDDKLEEDVDRISTLYDEDRLEEVRTSAECATKAEVEEPPEWESYIPVVRKTRELFASCTRPGLWEQAEPLPAQTVKWLKEENDCGDPMMIDMGDGQQSNEGPFDFRQRCDDLRWRVFAQARPTAT